MLIDKSTIISPDEIVAFRLTNGEEIMGKLVSKTDSTVSIAKPIIVVLSMVDMNKASIGFHPFMAAIADDQTVVFPLAGMSVHPVRASDDMTHNYLSATSNLFMPKKPGLLTP